MESGSSTHSQHGRLSATASASLRCRKPVITSRSPCERVGGVKGMARVKKFWLASAHQARQQASADLHSRKRSMPRVEARLPRS
jgi:hypothetical protein